MKSLFNKFPELRRLFALAFLVRRGFLRKYVERRKLEKTLKSVFKEPVWLSVKEFEGVFRLNPESHVFKRLVLVGSYEPLLANITASLIDPSRDVVDIGANIGFFTVLAARHTCGRVCAVEPTDNAGAFLKENVKRNSVASKVVIYEGAISDKCGNITIKYISGKEEYSSLYELAHPSIPDDAMVLEKSVACTTLENLVEEQDLAPGFIKIDVEGAEGAVFAGAWSVLEKHRPVVLAEFSPVLLEINGTDWRSILSKLESAGYLLLDPVNPNGKVGARKYGDLLAVPVERMDLGTLKALAFDAASNAGGL